MTDLVKAKLAPVREELRDYADGRTMIKLCREFRGLEEKGIYTYRVYYEYPDDVPKINEILKKNSLKVSHKNIVGGSYGYYLQFRIDEKGNGYDK